MAIEIDPELPLLAFPLSTKTSPVLLDSPDEIWMGPEAPCWLLPETRRTEPPDAAAALPP